MHKDAQHIYDHLMPFDPVAVAELQVRDRMQSIFNAIKGPGAFIEAVSGNNVAADEREITRLMSECLASPTSTLHKQIGSVFMRMTERYLRVVVDAEFEDGNIDRGLGS